MGRWSQQRRRGGGGGIPAAAPAGVALTAAVDFGGGDMLLTFAGPITADAGQVPDLGAFQLDGNPVTVSFVANVGANQLQITQSTGSPAGMTVSWLSQPPWIVEAIDLASTAVVT